MPAGASISIKLDAFAGRISGSALINDKTYKVLVDSDRGPCWAPSPRRDRFRSRVYRHNPGPGIGSDRRGHPQGTGHSHFSFWKRRQRSVRWRGFLPGTGSGCRRLHRECHDSGFAPFTSTVNADRRANENAEHRDADPDGAAAGAGRGRRADGRYEPGSNANAVVLKGKDLDALSDDPDELESQLQALAGPAAGPNGGEIYIDGFTGGQIPPKSSIREIRVNQNPFSAEFDRLGYGRIEILTKPGTDKLHGQIEARGNDSSFNSRNPILQTPEPSYYSYNLQGSVGGPISKTASYYVSAFGRNNQNVSVIDAVNPDDLTGPTLNEAYPNPSSRIDISPRLDLQLGQANTLTLRYDFYRAVTTNGGVGPLALPTQATNTAEHGEHACRQVTAWC